MVRITLPPTAKGPLMTTHDPRIRLYKSGDDHDETIPIATRYEIRFCGACPNAHLIFFDEAEEPICQATMSGPQALELVRKIEAVDPNFAFRASNAPN